jgi:HPt (histidine-containing phosphotransfer) domain-containing protein
MTRAPDLTDHPIMAIADPLHVPLQLVLAQLRHMDMSTLDPRLAAQLAALAKACALLATHLDALQSPPTIASPLPLLDRSVFDHLMDLAGPETAHDLLDRLIEDLTAVRQALDAARHAPDWESLRMQSHILIGLAGAVGATHLQTQAQDLNRLANRATDMNLERQFMQLNPPLNALIHFMQSQRHSAMAAQ